MATPQAGYTGVFGKEEEFDSPKDLTKPTAASKMETMDAIRYFMQGARQQEFYTTTGLSYFRSDLDSARADINSNYQKAIAELKPQQEASRTALDEMMRFMGIDPAAATTGMPEAVQID